MQSIVAALALALVLGGCSAGAGTSSAPAEAGKDTLVVAINNDPAKLSPLFLDINTGNWKVFSGMVAYDRT